MRRPLSNAAAAAVVVTALAWLMPPAPASGGPAAVSVDRSVAAAQTTGEFVDIDLTADELGLWITSADGTVQTRGPAAHFGDRPALGPGETVVELVPTPSGSGYWMFTSLGAVHTFGDATYHGDVSNLELAGPIVAAAALPDGSGYYLLGSDGGMFAMGAARFHGSIPQVLPGVQLDASIVALSATAAGYVLIGADGGTFTFGDAQFHGSIPGVLPGVALASGIVGLVPGPAGYLMLGGDGGIFNFGQSRFHGSLAGFDAPGVVAVAVLSDLSGYLMLDTSGTVWPFGDTRGVGVETSNGAGPASVAFDHDDAVIVEVSVSTAGSSSFFYEGLGQAIEVPSPGVARVVVDAPDLAAIDIDTTGIWTMRVLPLSYATHWRKGGDPVSAAGSDVYRIDRTPAGTRLEFVSDGYIAVSARAVDGSDARLLYNGGVHMGDQTVTDAVTLPLVGGPMIVAVQSNFAHTVELIDPVLPRSVEVVGDSVGITLVINSPSSLDGVLSLRDSAIEGCGIIDSGSMISGGRTRRNFSACVNFAQRWAADVAAHRPDVVLVVIGAWEVFDLSIDGVVVPFGSEAHDEVLRNGLERVRAAFEPLDTSVALLEVPCQFPRPGGGLTPLPERGERWRTDHLNELLAEIAATDDQFNDRMKLVTSPPALCDDPSIADNPSIRWDGTHYGPAGGALVWSHLRDQLLRMP